MQVSVKGKQMDVGDALRGHVASSLEAVVGKYFGNPIEAQAAFAREAHYFRCDLSVHVGRDILVNSHGEGSDAYGAFDAAADRVDKIAPEIPSLSVGDAVMRLDLSNEPALLFRNRAHGGVNLVYRRADGNIGWGDPDYRA